jgi:hypothetical protein
MRTPPNPGGLYTPAQNPVDLNKAFSLPTPRNAEVSHLLKNHKQLRKTGQDTELILPDTPEGSKRLDRQLDIHS